MNAFAHHLCGLVPKCPSSIADLQVGPVEETISNGSWCRGCCWSFRGFLLLGLLLPLPRKVLIAGSLSMHLCLGNI